jgi:hypothetical protein
VKKTLKREFRPVISQIKLNPEQAVLSCACYDRGDLLIYGSSYYDYREIPGAGVAVCTSGKVKYFVNHMCWSTTKLAATSDKNTQLEITSS